MNDMSRPWNRLLLYISKRFSDPTKAYYFSTGLDMGLAIALRHPEYALALRQENENDIGKDAPDTNQLVDEIVTSVPVEVYDGS